MYDYSHYKELSLLSQCLSMLIFFSFTHLGVWCCPARTACVVASEQGRWSARTRSVGRRGHSLLSSAYTLHALPHNLLLTCTPIKVQKKERKKNIRIYITISHIFYHGYKVTLLGFLTAACQFTMKKTQKN